MTFVPAAGYTGPASFQFAADDGYQSSTPATVDVTVSDAALVSLDFQEREPRLNVGGIQTLVIVGNFTDQTGVILAPSYVTFQSTNPSVMSVSPTGVVTGLSDGTSVIVASAQGLQAATAGTVGVPTDYQDLELYQNGLTASLQAETLAAVVGSHQFTVSTAPGVNLTDASTGTLYFVSNPNVITVSADGLVTAGNVGNATLTIINGPAEAVVPIQVEMPTLGPVTLGTTGAVVSGSDGSIIMVPAGAAPAGTTISIAPMPQSQFPLQVPTAIDGLGAFQLNISSSSLTLPAQLVVPAPAGMAVGTQVMFYQAGSLPDANGNQVPMLLETAVGTVEADGFIHDDITQAGSYIFGTMPNSGVVNGMITLSTGAAVDSTNFALFGSLAGGAGIGAFFGLSFGFSVTFPVGPADLTMESIPEHGLPTLTPLTINVAPGNNPVSATVNSPAPNLALPVINSMSLVPASAPPPIPGQPSAGQQTPAVLTINGQNFVSPGGTLTINFQSSGATGHQPHANDDDLGAAHGRLAQHVRPEPCQYHGGRLGPDPIF